jgi:hypothetical protein
VCNNLGNKFITPLSLKIQGSIPDALRNKKALNNLLELLGNGLKKTITEKTVACVNAMAIIKNKLVDCGIGNYGLTRK